MLFFVNVYPAVNWIDTKLSIKEASGSPYRHFVLHCQSLQFVSAFPVTHFQSYWETYSIDIVKFFLTMSHLFL